MDLGKVSQYSRRTASDLHADDFFLRMELFKWANFLLKVLASTDRRAGVCSLLLIICTPVTRRNHRL